MSSELPVRITDRRAAVLLSDVRTATLLKPFMRRECTVSQAALEAGISLKQMHYYVTQFLGRSWQRLDFNSTASDSVLKRLHRIFDGQGRDRFLHCLVGHG